MVVYSNCVILEYILPCKFIAKLSRSYFAVKDGPPVGSRPKSNSTCMFVSNQFALWDMHKWSFEDEDAPVEWDNHNTNGRGWGDVVPAVDTGGTKVINQE